MQHSPVFAAALVVVTLQTTSALADIALVEKGVPRAVIVVADTPSPAVRYAAEELRLHVEKATGASLPIVAAGKVPADEVQALVLVGDSRFAKELGAETAELAPESTLVRTSGSRLLLIGGDRGSFSMRRYDAPCGTLYAVYDFLEAELGIRWLWPGEVGTVIPQRDTITVARVDRAFHPPLIKRNIRHGLHDRSGTVARLGRTKTDAAMISLDFNKWTRRRRLGRRANFAFGHAFNHWLDKYGKDYPDWFAMMPNGKRVTPGKPYPSLERAKLCVTNEKLLDFIARQAMDRFEKNPSCRSFSVCPNDSRGYCMCPKCKALDHPDGVPDEMNYPGVADMRYPSLSDRYVWFWNQIAERIVKRFPDHCLGAYAYSNYRFPPLREELSPNVVISYVGFNYLNADYTAQSRKDWAGWAATGCKMFLRPNLLLVGHGFPLNYCHGLAADLKECFRTGMLGTDFDSMTHQYAGQAPIFYMLTSLLWDPAEDTDAILNDFMTSAYGPAAPVMRRYWGRLEKMTTETASTIGRLWKTDAHHNARSFDDLVPTIYTDAVLGELGALIDEAREAANRRPDILARIDVASVGLEYAEVQRNVLTGVRAYNSKTDPDLAHLVPALERKDAFFREHTNDRTIGPILSGTIIVDIQPCGAQGADRGRSDGQRVLGNADAN